MKRASYRAAIAWLLDNDDTDWLNDMLSTGEALPSVTACLVADLFGVDVTRVTKDLLQLRDKRGAA